MTNSSIPVPSKGSLGRPAGADASAQRRSTLVVILLSNVLLALGFQLWRSLFNNFAVEELGVRADQMGVIQSIREIPGLLSFGVGMLALLMTEMRIAGLAVILMGVGIAMTGGAHSLSGLVASTLVMSVGFHFFGPSNSSAMLMLTDEDEAPRWLGILNGSGALAAVASAAAVFLALDRLGFRTLFYVTGALVFVGGLILLPWTRRSAHSARARQRTPIRRRYWLYYTLEFLMGSRRHIFTTFAVFLLVEEHHVTAQVITVLFVINNLISTLVYPLLGWVITRIGERRILTLNFLLLIPVFLGYAYVPLLPVLYALFVADHLLFGFRMALQSYFQKIALSPQEITPNISLGQTINHVAAIIIPVVGGVVWEMIGSRYTFLIGVGIVMITLIVVQWMRAEQAATPNAVAVE
jgi:predicted MFS family arabinose efflux permease